MGVIRGGGAGQLREQERGWTAVGEGLSTLKASIPDQSALLVQPPACGCTAA